METEFREPLLPGLLMPLVMLSSSAAGLLSFGLAWSQYEINLIGSIFIGIGGFFAFGFLQGGLPIIIWVGLPLYVYLSGYLGLLGYGLAGVSLVTFLLCQFQAVVPKA